MKNKFEGYKTEYTLKIEQLVTFEGDRQVWAPITTNMKKLYFECEIRHEAKMFTCVANYNGGMYASENYYDKAGFAYSKKNRLILSDANGIEIFQGYRRVY